MLSLRVSTRIFSGEASTSKKRKREKEDKKCQKVEKRQKMGDNTDDLPMDYISKLPEHIIHHILTFLRCPKDVARISALSTTWKKLWKSLLIFDFDEKNFKTNGKPQILEFLEFVESSLVTGLPSSDYVHKFRLSMTSFDPKKMSRKLDRWLASIASKKVGEIEIHLVTKKIRRFSVPLSVLVSESLTTLKLCGCSLSHCDIVKLPNLRSFSIKGMVINADIIQSFINRCPLIEDLRLVNCLGLVRLHISTLLKLNRVEICQCQGLKSVRICAPNLQIFWFCDSSLRDSTLDLDQCPDLRSLTLKGTNMANTNDLVSRFPLLETLTLNDCNFIHRIAILSGKLQKLEIVRCTQLVEVVVDAPSLHVFKFTGKKLPAFSINAPNVYAAKINFTPNEGDKFVVKEFFEKVKKSEGLKLIVSCNDGGVVIYEELSGFPDIEFLPTKSYNLELKGPSFNSIEYLKSWFRVTHPTSVIVYSPPGSQLLKFLKEDMVNKEESLTCCTYYLRKCWMHYLKKVSIVEEVDVEDAGNKILSKAAFILEW